MIGDVNRGAPGYFSDGKIRKEDEGALRVAVFTDSNKKAVVIHFGSHARTLVEMIFKEANSL